MICQLHVRNLYFWHGLWILCGKPETGQVAMIMRFTRNNYHYKIIKIKNESSSRAKQSLANALVNNRTRDYWSEIKKINKSKIEPISIVNGEYAHKDISCQYKSLYSSMTSDLFEPSHMYDSIKADINNACLSNNHSCGSFYDHTVYRINVVNAIRSLCAGKNDGVDDICSDNLKPELSIFNRPGMSKQDGAHLDPRLAYSVYEGVYIPL